ncbi:MAG: DMT family protein, partial [Elusimicrobiaceae bacterium]|nr:DMT family protein [Elusimicrobiaceae bacterium]
NVYNMWKPIVLLVLSNLFMTFAWYGHLKHKSTALWAVILISWAIAFFEYCLQVPANRLGSTYFSVTQLKVMQEIITLSVFTIFSIFYFQENFRWNHLAAFCLLVGAVFLTFKEW